MADLDALAVHKAFFEDLISYLPPNESTESEAPAEKQDKPPPPRPPDLLSTSPSPPPPRAKVRPGFEGAPVVRRKRGS
jgi:hypothetical protein